MIHFICALKCEATPLLDYFGLEHRGRENLFNSYSNEERQTSLTVTGVGKINAAAGTMHAIDCFQARKDDIWLNVGIAGHRNLPLGSVLLANRVVDVATSDTWFPQILLTDPLPSTGLATVDTPVTSYGEDMVDMEAAGFFATASRTGTAELIHCLKVISDNEQSPHDGLGARQISALIAGQLTVIEDIVMKLLDLSAVLPGADGTAGVYDSLIEHWHFTGYQRIRLQFLLNRWNVLLPGNYPMDTFPRGLNNGAGVLNYLEQKLDSLPVDYSPEAGLVGGREIPN